MTKSNNSVRKCNRCKEPIEVGRGKLGKAVFPGGICYDCYRQVGKHFVRPATKEQR